MDKPRTTPKDFFLWAGAMVAFYWSVIAFIFLIFNYIDYALPNPLSYLPDPYSGGIPYEMASILVLFPIYVVISMLIRRDIARDPSRKDIWVRRWALILTLFLAAVSMTVDVIMLLTAFFRGEEITVAFLIKVLLVFLVAAAVFMHFIADYWGYWDMNRPRERTVAAGVGVLVLAAILAGFFIVGTPWQARLYRFDQQKVNDLQNIQYQVVSYWQQKQKLPVSLSDLQDPISGYVVPVDSQSGQPYEYKSTGAMSFELCANFNASGQGNSSYSGPIAASPVPGVVSAVWQHGSGRTCFERTIDSQLHPPAKR